jgi:hypothetical protein
LRCGVRINRSISSAKSRNAEIPGCCLLEGGQMRAVQFVRKNDCLGAINRHHASPMTDLEDDSGKGSPQPFLIERDTVADDDRRRVAPAALRNETAIVRALAKILEEAGLRDKQCRALELASGTGQHCAALARVFPGIAWTPSDRDDMALESIAAWRAHAGLANLSKPKRIDLDDPDWHGGVDPELGLILAVNLLHISRWEVTGSVMAGSGQLLAPEGRLVIYGCFKRDGDWVAQSNEAFDVSLRIEDDSWGVRDTADVLEAARARGLAPVKKIEMPANNTLLVLRRD